MSQFPYSRIIIFLFVFLFACSSQAPSSYPGPQGPGNTGSQTLAYPGPNQFLTMNGTPVIIALSDPPQPAAGKASISGTIVSGTLNRLIPGNLFYLTPAVGPDRRSLPEIIAGPDTQKGDVRGSTDANGQFVLKGVAPGNYYLVVWGVYDWVPVQTSKEDENPLLIELTENQRRNVGVVYIPWP